MRLVILSVAMSFGANIHFALDVHIQRYDKDIPLIFSIIKSFFYVNKKGTPKLITQRQGL